MTRIHVDKINIKSICTVLMVCCWSFFWQDLWLPPFPLQAGISCVSIASLLGAVTFPWLQVTGSLARNHNSTGKVSQKVKWDHPGPCFWRNVFLISIPWPYIPLFFFFTTTFPLSICRKGQQVILKLLFNFSSVQSVSHCVAPACCDTEISAVRVVPNITYFFPSKMIFTDSYFLQK